MFYRDGPSKRCIGNDYKPCEKNSDSECVGKAFTNYIYHLSTGTLCILPLCLIALICYLKITSIQSATPSSNYLKCNFNMLVNKTCFCTSSQQEVKKILLVSLKLSRYLFVVDVYKKSMVLLTINVVYVEQHAEEQVPGGWDTWSKWTECSKKCNGGTRSRERICNNPKPENGGEECEGEPEESIGCNEDACEPGYYSIVAYYSNKKINKKCMKKYL